MSNPQSLSLEHLIAFNDELAALARAGVPLEQGLVALGKDSAGTLSTLAAEIGAQLEQGQSLTQVVAQPQSRLPVIYRAVVCAGLRSGRLSAALEGLTFTLRRMAELRLLMRRATAYPLLVIVTAYGLLLFGCGMLIPQLHQTYLAFGVPSTAVLDLLVALADTMPYWWPWPPLLLVLFLLGEWYRNRRQLRHLQTGDHRLPGMYRSGRLSAFSDLLALLVEHEVSLVEAVPLAAEASGDLALRSASEQFASELRQGSTRPTPGLPPLIGAMLASATSPGELSQSLRRIARLYERRARRSADWLRQVLPALLVIGIGGGLVLLTALGFWGPWLHMLHVLSHPEFAR
ncbi:MAG TPA: type II secretion system F family protein [Pirellulaceae bacterium]|nr:type II secretion system F family protein [Pirellulaceae bacterium]